ncbi:MAG: efflux RND transporter periplasmic adaptor subunit, partial [Candidatus Riflebacteria bacterium]
MNNQKSSGGSVLLKFSLAVAVLSASAWLGISSANAKKGAENKKKPQKQFVLQELQPITLYNELQLAATVDAIEKAWLSTTVDGPIDFLPFREGDTVKAGEKLVGIARESLKAELALAEASLQVARARLVDLRSGYRPQEINKARQAVKESQKSHDFMKKEVARVEDLVKNGALAHEELEKTQVKLAADEARLVSARNQLEMLESGMTNTTIAIQVAVVGEAEARMKMVAARCGECEILAPFTGMVTELKIAKGDMAIARQPLIQLINPDSLVLRVFVPERFAETIKTGMKVEYSVDAIQGDSFFGVVRRVFPRLDEKLKTRPVEIEPENRERLLPGMFARARIRHETFENFIAVAEDVVQKDKKGNSYVFVVGDDAKAQKREIETGPTIGGKIVVIKGLRAGEKIIAAGFEKIKDGEQLVLPLPAD